MGQCESDRKKILATGSGFRRGKRNPDHGFRTGSQRRRFHRTVFNGLTVFFDHPIDDSLIKVAENKFVSHFDGSFGQVNRSHRDGLIDFADLLQMRVRIAIRINQPIDAEVAVVGLISEIAAVGKECLVAFLHAAPERSRYGRVAVRTVFGAQTLIHPVPDQSASEIRVAFEQVPVFLKIADGISHRVCVFFEKERALRMVRCLFFDLLRRPVGAAVQVHNRPHLAIVKQARRINLLRGLDHVPEVVAVTGFIAQ